MKAKSEKMASGMAKMTEVIIYLIMRKINEVESWTAKLSEILT